VSKKLKCENCGIDLSGTTLFENKGAAVLCLPCSVIDDHNKESISYRKVYKK
jgi:hypothetical protein